MRTAILVAIAIGFTMPSAWAQAKSKAPDVSSETLKRHVCDCRKMNTWNGKLNEMGFAGCTRRRLNYEVQASTVASIVCPVPKAKSKKG